MSLTRLDDTDRALLALLRENARAPTSELARRLKLSRTTVQSRLARLERQQVIAGYTVTMGDDAEAALVRAHVMITVAPKQAGAIEAALRKIVAVRSLHSVSGSFDLLAVVAAYMSTSFSGKMVAIWGPTLLFFSQGFEHAVVNMFLIPVGMLLGANIDLSTWWLWNQIPVTLGNLVGGMVFTGLAIYGTHSATPKTATAAMTVGASAPAYAAELERRTEAVGYSVTR